MSGTIYRIYVEQVGKAYVGCTRQSIDFVWTQAKSKLCHHNHPCKSLQEAVDKYGLSQAKFEILGVVEDESLLPAKQSEWMAKYVTFNRKVTRAARKTRGGKPVTYGGIPYPSISAAARGSGLTIKQMRWRLEFGYENEEEVQIWPFTPEKFPMNWDGTPYESIRQASLSTGISYAKMRHYHSLNITTPSQAKRYEDMQVEEQRKLDARRRREWLEEQTQKKRDELARLEANLNKLRKDT